MPFTFKLSKRLAQMHAGGLGISVAGRLLPVTGARLQVVQVVVAPDALTPSPLQNEHYAVSCRSHAGGWCGTL